jgi:uncharacterized protein
MSHRFYEGEIFHKRFSPKIHQFTYDYFFLDIDLNEIDTLHNRAFSIDSLNFMSFYSKDHFGNSESIVHNARDLIASLEWKEPDELRFITLPRMAHFVFNPISMLLLLDSQKCLTHAIAEVHNYNGGRILYPMTLEIDSKGRYIGTSPKSMYVSPFMGYDGEYHFTIDYTPEHFDLAVQLHHNGTYLLIADFKGTVKPFSTASVRSLLCAHTFLSFFVVTRTLWQTLRLKLKGLQWNSPRAQDQIKKETV